MRATSNVMAGLIAVMLTTVLGLGTIAAWAGTYEADEGALWWQA